jgi:iron-sulfur cluster repair protein YtfE (RIC family)
VRTSSDTFSSVHSFFTWDHHRLDGVLDAVEKLVDEGDLERAQRAFCHYDRGMRRHMRIEEEVVFLLYAFERTGEAKGPVQLMREEHAVIQGFIEEMGTSLTRQDTRAFRAARDALGRFLPEHHLREEQMLYPLLDSLLGTDEAEKTIARLRAE